MSTEPSEKERFLETFIEVEEDKAEEDEPAIFRPLISKPTLIHPQSFKNVPDKLPDDFPPIFAFHSFKGGVGRTIHTIAFTLLVRSFRNYKVLLVDADLEAPGITLMLEKENRNLEISFADMLALVHSDSEEESSESLDLIAERILKLDNIFILPDFRSSDQMVSLEIKPEHLIKYSDNPYIISDVLCKLGKRLGADVVIADLRAGFSEISAGLLLDPRVHRIFVTTLSDQSFTGTLNALEHIGNLSPCITKYMPQPNVIISMIPESYQRQGAIDRYKTDLEKKIADSFSDKGGRPDSFLTKLNDGSILKYQISPVYETPFDNDLLVLPEEWEKVTDSIGKSEIMNKITPLLNKVRKVNISNMFFTNSLEGMYSEEIDKRIKRFSDPQKISFGDLYINTSMRRLATDYANRVPMAVIDGIKGSGKTTFFFYLMRKKSWKMIVKDLIKDDLEYDPLIIPIVIPSKDYKINQIIEKKRTQSVRFLKYILSLDKPPLWNEIWETFCKKNVFSVADWIDYFVWSLGFETGKKGAGNNLLSKMNTPKKDFVFVIDIPEDIDEKYFQTLIEVPKWLEMQPQRTSGIIMFCDLSAFKKNIKDISEQYLPYRMKMNQEDIVRFFYFICVKIGLFKEKISDMSINHLIDKIELNLNDNRLDLLRN